MPISIATGTSEAIEEAYNAGREAALAAQEQITAGGRSVVLLFASIHCDLKEAMRGVSSVIDAPLFGCTTYSEGTEKGYTADSITVVLISGPELEVGIGVGENLAEDPKLAAKIAYQRAVAPLQNKPKLLFAIPDTALTHTGEAAVEGLIAVADPNCPVIGAAPADWGKWTKMYQFAGSELLSGAFLLLALSGPIDAVTITRSGFRPMGVPGVVTKSEGTKLLAVGDETAISFVQRYVGDNLEPDILGIHPIALMDQTARREDRDHYVIRSPFFVDHEEGAVIYGAHVPVGSTIQMGRNTRELIFESTACGAKRLREVLGDRKPLGILFTSCAGRMLAMGMETPKELDIITEHFPGVPIGGFYGSSEIGAFDKGSPALERARFHNLTLVLCALFASESP